MKRAFPLSTAALAVGLTLSAAVGAQPLPPSPLPRANPGPAMLPPQEILAIVRAVGLEPLHRPLRQGPGYVLRALDPAGRENRIMVDGASGRIVRIVPLPAPRYAVVPPLYGGPAPRVAMVPDGYGPNSRLPALPPEVGGIPPAGPEIGVAGRSPAAGTTSHSAPPPLPRPRPKIAATQTPAAAPPAAAASQPPAAASPVAAAKESRAGTGTPSLGPPATPVEEAE